MLAPTWEDNEAASELREDYARMVLYQRLSEENKTASTNCFNLTHSKALCSKWDRMAEHYAICAATLRTRIEGAFR